MPPAFAACGALVPLAGVGPTPLLFVWTAAPFLLFGLFGALHLARAPEAVLRPRLIAVCTAFGVLLIVGWWFHKPIASPGMNFGIVFFPLYAAIAAPIAYALGRLAARRAFP